MKKLFTLFSLFIVPLISSAQAPPIQWQNSLGGSGTDFGNDIQQTRDRGYILAGVTGSMDGDATGKTNNSSDFWVVKLGSNGALKWQKSYGGSKSETAYSIQQTSDDGYIVCGFSNSIDGDITGHHGPDTTDFWVVKLDSVGTLQWEKSLGGTNFDNGADALQTFDGGYIVVGYTKSKNGDVSMNHGFADYWVVKLNASGSIVWEKTFGGTKEDYATSVWQCQDSSLIVSGYTDSSDGDVSGHHGSYNDCWVIKLDNNGTVLWNKCYGGNGIDGSSTVRQTTDGGYILGASSRANSGDVSGNHGGADYWIVKLSSAGIIQWQKSYGGTSDDVPVSAEQTMDGGYIVGGFTQSTNGDVVGMHGFVDYWLVKIDSIGTLEWQRCLGGTAQEVGNYAIQASDGGYLITGRCASNNGDVISLHTPEENWVVKLGGIPTKTPSYIGTEILFSIYPNPATRELIIQQADELKSIEILNVIGQTELIAPGQTEGKVVIDVSSLTRGVYFVKLINKSGESQLSKLILK